ncbi:MAG: Flp pilus assembly protein CpaB [Pseudomonadota bacterium]
MDWIKLSKKWFEAVRTRWTDSAHLKRAYPWLLPAGLALLGTLLLWDGIQRYKRNLGFGLEPAEVLTSSRDLREGKVLELRDFETRRVPKDLLPMGVLLRGDLQRIPGLTVLRSVARGSMVLWSDLDVNYMPPTPARRVVKGYRALAIGVTDTSSVAQAIRPADHVDLLLTLTPPGESHPSTVTLLQNVAVLSVGKELNDDSQTAYSSLTLMVLPGEAGIITHASQVGRLTLSLRHPDDAATENSVPAIGMEELVETALRGTLQEERNRTVEVIRGGSTSLEGPLP